MKCMIQRVSRARVTVAGEVVGQIGRGILSFVAVEKEDDEATGTRMLEKILSLRIFEDDQGKMNRSVLDVHGEHLMVSQFTLAADTSKGTRPSFTGAATPERALEIFNSMVAGSQVRLTTQTGKFRAHMQVELVNDGPVTFWLEAH